MSTNDNNKKIHHANIVLGDGRLFVLNILENDLNFSFKANPDFLLVESESFGIDDARNLEKWAIGKPFLGGVKASLIIVSSITHEAQNALLKVLEEPPLGTYIFINIQNLGGLLATFLSRVRVLDVSREYPKETVSPKEKNLDNARKFFNAKINERFTMIRSLSKNEDKTPMRELVKNLEKVCFNDYAENKQSDKSKSEMAKNVLTAKIFASARGSSPKMLLEWLSCVLPSSEF